MNEIENMLVEKFGWEKLPKVLYKYRTWSDEFHRRLLTDQELYFPSPLSFNDPFDCSVLLTEVSSKRDIMYKSNAIIKEDNPGLARKDRRIEAANIRREKHYLSIDEAKLIRKHNLENDYGVCSLSSNHTNLVMWSHYSESHKGFCAGFDISKIVYDQSTQKQFSQVASSLILCNKVKYYAKYPVLELHLGSTSDIEIAIEGLQPLLAKSVHWSYEEEWRLISFMKNMISIKFKKLALKTLYLGCRIKENDKKEILEIVQSNYPSLDVYQAKMKEKEFGLEFERII